MSARLYVAGSIHQTGRVQYVQQVARRRGWEIAYDWTMRENLKPGSWDDESDRGQQIARAEVNAIRRAALVVVLATEDGLGQWIELGVALGAGVPVWLVDTPRQDVMWQHPLVTRMTQQRLMELL